MMTIDRLEELHTLTGQFAKTAIDAGYDSTAVEFVADIRSLIDAEIERQSVGDGVVQDAIEFIACEKRFMNSQKNNIYWDLAIDALGAYQKQEPCEWRIVEVEE